MNPITKTEDKEQLDINGLLNSIPIDTSQVITPIVNTGTNTEQYDVNNLLSNIQEYKEPSLKDKSMGGNYQDALRLFAQGGPLGLYANRGFVKGADEFIKPLKNISIEDWKQHSLLAPMLEYGLGSLTDPNSPETIAAKNQLLQKAHSAYEGIKNISGEQIYNLGKEIFTNPFGVAGEAAKGVIYDPEQIPLGGIAGKGVSKLLETPLEKIRGKFKTLEEEFGIANPKKELTEPVEAEIIKEATAPLKAEVTLEGANYRPELDTQPVTKTVPRKVSDLSNEEFQQYINRPLGEDYNFGTKEIITHEPKTVEIIPENPVMPAERLNPQTISQKEQILKDVGIENFRNSALEGDYQNASSQYLTSKASNEAYGKGMAEQILHEKEALNKHLGNIEETLGGTVPREGIFTKTDEIKRGKVIKDALEEAQETHKTKTTELYNKASQEVGAVPVELTTLKDYLNKKSNFVHAPEKSLREGVLNYLEEQGLLNEQGAVKPMTVGQSEELRKFINTQYNYETKGKIGDLVNNIDEDVFKNVQGKTYEEARAHFKAGKEIYDNPKAIKDLLSDEGTNQKIKDELVMDKLSSESIGESQFRNLIDTLNKTGKTDAIKEIQTNLINRIRKAGQSEISEPWNGRAAAKEFQNLGEKLQVAFADNPEILAQLSKNIEAGNILHIPTKYPGAAVQTHLLKNKFSEMALQRAATVIGGGAGSFAGPLGGALGAAVGEYGGGKGASALKSNRQLQQLQKDIKSGTPLNELNKNQLKE
jgi:hypothetical protein